MADEHDTATPTSGAPVVSSADADKKIQRPEDAKKPEDLVDLAQTPETHRRLRELEAHKKGIKIPADLDKVSNAKAKELVEHGLVEDHELPGKWYRRKADGFIARIPNYTFEAYHKDLQDEWDEVQLTSAPPEEKA